MWTLRNLIEHCNSNSAEVNGRWVPARPINYTCRTLKEKFVESWAVFTGRAEAFTWPEGQ